MALTPEMNQFISIAFGVALSVLTALTVSSLLARQVGWGPLDGNPWKREDDE